MLTVHKITYTHPDKELLFDNVSFSIHNHDKVALIGNNGIGKSTFLKILAGDVLPTKGNIICPSKPYYVPQHYGQFGDFTIARALNIETKLSALYELLAGNYSDENLEILNEDWTIQERCQEAFSYWKLADLPLETKLSSLSGGQKTKVFLAGIMIHQPDYILLDEPTNHLDLPGRELLYDFITYSNNAFVIVSHDRKLLELLQPTYELEKRGISVYGGNYSFYKTQKENEEDALKHQLVEKEKALKKAKKEERESLERKQRQDAQGKNKKAREGVSRIAMKKLKNQAESSTARMKEVHSEKINMLANELSDTRKRLPGISQIKMNFEGSSIHQGKVLVSLNNINFAYSTNPLWKKPLNFKIYSNDRISIKGANGSGKTTFIRLLLGQLMPIHGEVKRADFNFVFIDQDYSLIKNELSVYEQAQSFNYDGLLEHEIKIRLNRYLFQQDYWDNSCSTLSGGEKMRLMLCCLMISNQAPDIFVLDEPTNNLDIQNMEILTNAVNDYKGTVIVVSHDQYFLNAINVNKVIDLNQGVLH